MDCFIMHPFQNKEENSMQRTLGTSYRRDLGDGLVLRWSTAQDTERIATLLSMVYRDKADEPPNTNAMTRCAASRNSTNYITLLQDIEADNPGGDIFIITDNLSSHNSAQTCAWMAEHPRLHHVFIPTGACWLNLQEGWWRLFRRDALAGQSFATP